MWIVVLIIITVLLLLTANLHNKNRTLEKQVHYLKPLVETAENVRDILYYCETAPKMNYLYLSPTVNELIGPNTREEHMQNPEKIFDIVHPDDQEILTSKKFGQLDFCDPIKVRLRNHQGNYIWFEEYATPVYKDGKFVAVQGILRNIDDKVALQQQLEYKSTHDTLTDLYNREFFQTKLNEYNEKKDVPIAVIMADLDELKYINDHYGHLMGDRLIQAVGHVLKKYSNEQIIVARIGGDEFAIILADATVAQADKYIDNIRDDLQSIENDKPFTPIKLSIGYAYSASSIGVMERLLGEADVEMYKEKNGKRAVLS